MKTADDNRQKDGGEQRGEGENQDEDDDDDEEQQRLEEELANKIVEMRLTPYGERPQLYQIENNHWTKILVGRTNKALKRLVPKSSPLKELNTMSFAMALLIQEKVKRRQQRKKSKPAHTDRDQPPPWTWRLET